MNERIPGDKKVPNTEPPLLVLIVFILIFLAIITPFLIMLWRWALA